MMNMMVTTPAATVLPAQDINPMMPQGTSRDAVPTQDIFANLIQSQIESLAGKADKATDIPADTSAAESEAGSVLVAQMMGTQTAMPWTGAQLVPDTAAMINMDSPVSVGTETLIPIRVEDSAIAEVAMSLASGEPAVQSSQQTITSYGNSSILEDAKSVISDDLFFQEAVANAVEAQVGAENQAKDSSNSPGGNADQALEDTFAFGSEDLRIQSSQPENPEISDRGVNTSQQDDTQKSDTAMSDAYRVAGLSQAQNLNRQGESIVYTETESKVDAVSADITGKSDTPKAEIGSPVGVDVLGKAIDAGKSENIPHDAVRVADVDTQKQVIDQIVREVRLRRFNGGNDLTIHLNPPELGTLKLRVVQDSFGMTSQIQASSEHVKNLIQVHVPMLVEALSKVGVDMGSVTVTSGTSFGTLMQDMSQDQTQQQFQNRDNQGFARYAPAFASFAVDDSAYAAYGREAVGYSWLA